MFYGEVPFNGDNLKELYSNIKSAKITQNSSSSSALRDLLNLIFVKDYRQRITVEKCLEHRWFKIGNKTPTDTGILKKNIIEEIVNKYNGQIIITTHNTLVMSSDTIPSSSFYTVDTDNMGNRMIESITDSSDKRVHPNHNKQSRYIDGKYKAIPDKIHIALKELD